MKEIKLTPQEVKVLIELLSCDMDAIGFDKKSEQNAFRNIYLKLTAK